MDQLTVRFESSLSLGIFPSTCSAVTLRGVLKRLSITMDLSSSRSCLLKTGVLSSALCAIQVLNGDAVLMAWLLHQEERIFALSG